MLKKKKIVYYHGNSIFNSVEGLVWQLPADHAYSSFKDRNLYSSESLISCSLPGFSFLIKRKKKDR